MGAKLRTRLVVAFITLTLLPTIVLFFFSISFITNSLEFWFNVPVEQALENSLDIGRRIYKQAEDRHQFFMKRISYQIKAKNLVLPGKQKALSSYIQVVQREFNLHAVEVYDTNLKRLTFALAPELENRPFGAISADNFQKEATPKDRIGSISEYIPAGELVRTIGTVPFGAEYSTAKAFIALTILIPPDLSANMASVSRGYEEYQQIKLLKKPIAVTYYITLSIVALLVVFCAIWFAFYLAKTITIPIMELADGTRRVADGDLRFSIDLNADDEIGSLVDSFNKMTEDLRIGREQLERSARLLREQNISIEERRQYMEIVLRNVSAGVITLDANGVITTINKAAESMLILKPENILNRSYSELLPEQHLKLANEVMETLITARDDALETTLRLTIAGRPRSFLMHVNALKDDSDNHMGIVVVFDDLTELEKAQRMAAWREVARRIAHEVKNPLTPIKLSAQRLKRKYSERLDEPVFEECTEMIIDHVDLLRNIVNEFASFASFPTANMKPCNLPSIIDETIALYREVHRKIQFEVKMPDKIPELNLDRQQIKQAMINLFDNAISAMKDKGNIIVTLIHDPILKMVILEVVDDGSGISDEEKTRLFEPYFSTKKSGMGLGLTIVSTIVADHNGRIRVQDNHPHGAKFVIELPA
jgi:two-component system nitrogen regulation sensor histidine kinase NtrY